MTIATSGRGHQAVLNADVFSWSELPELLAAEDLVDTPADPPSIDVPEASPN